MPVFVRLILKLPGSFHSSLLPLLSWQLSRQKMLRGSTRRGPAPSSRRGNAPAVRSANTPTVTGSHWAGARNVFLGNFSCKGWTHLLKQIVFFPLLALQEPTYHWICFGDLSKRRYGKVFFRGLKQMQAWERSGLSRKALVGPLKFNKLQPDGLK